MHAVDFLDAEALHQAVLDHGLAPCPALFGGLEDDGDGAIEIAGFGKVFGGAEQHGGVAVMAAGVHLAGGLAGVVEAGGLDDGQRVHIGTEADDVVAAVGAALDNADDAGAADAFDHVVAAELAQLFGHQRRGADGVVHGLGMLVDVTAPGGDLGVELGDAVLDRHGATPSVYCLVFSTKWPGATSS